MARNQQWQDDYWLPLMQLYLKKPVGVKPVLLQGNGGFRNGNSYRSANLIQ